jgi:bile acid:Na+ symporter, BASS family
VFFQLLAWCATGALVLDGALRLGPSSLRALREQPGLLLRFLFVVWVVVPLLAIAVAQLARLRGAGAAALLLMAICPGVPLLISSARSASGSLHTALIVLLATAVTAPLLLPVWARVLSALYPVELAIPSRRIVLALLPTVFAPLALGFGVRAISSRVAAALARVTDVLFRVGLAVLMSSLLLQGAPILLEVRLRAYLAVVILTIGEAWLGYWAGGPKLEDRRTTSLAAALGNPALVLAVVTESYPGYEAGALLAAYVLFRSIVLIPLLMWLKPAPGPGIPA